MTLERRGIKKNVYVYITKKNTFVQKKQDSFFFSISLFLRTKNLHKSSRLDTLSITYMSEEEPEFELNFGQREASSFFEADLIATEKGTNSMVEREETVEKKAKKAEFEFAEVSFTPFYCCGNGYSWEEVNTFFRESDINCEEKHFERPKQMQYNTMETQDQIYEKEGSHREKVIRSDIAINNGLVGFAFFMHEIIKSYGREISTNLKEKLLTEPFLLGFCKFPKERVTTVCLFTFDVDGIGEKSDSARELLNPIFKFKLRVKFKNDDENKLYFSTKSSRVAIQHMIITRIIKKKKFQYIMENREEIENKNNPESKEDIVDLSISTCLVTEWLVFSPFMRIMKEMRLRGVKVIKTSFFKLFSSLVANSVNFMKVNPKKGMYNFQDLYAVVFPYDVLRKNKMEILNYLRKVYRYASNLDQLATPINLFKYFLGRIEEIRESWRQAIHNENINSIFGHIDRLVCQKMDANACKPDFELDYQEDDVEDKNEIFDNEEERVKRESVKSFKKQERKFVYHILEEQEKEVYFQRRDRSRKRLPVVNYRILNTDFISTLLDTIRKEQIKNGGHLRMGISDQNHLLKDFCRPNKYFDLMNHISKLQEEFEAYVRESINSKLFETVEKKEAYFKTISNIVNVYSNSYKNPWRWIVQLCELKNNSIFTEELYSRILRSITEKKMDYTYHY